MRPLIGVSLVLVVVCVSLGCDPRSTPINVDPPVPGDSESAIIGTSGGDLHLGSANLEVPPDALPEEIEIRITATDQATPEAFLAYSPVYRLEPAGQVFDEPVTITLPFDGPAETATIFWTARGGEQYVALPTTVVGSVATAQVTHFSQAFVGSGCEGDDCCDRANGQLDLLLVVDNSNSMNEEQAALAEQIPRMARVLASGDLDDDGVQDFPALQSLRVGVVTTDMGTLGYSIQTCSEPMSGDNGVLQTTGSGESCEASYPSFAELSADDGASGVEGFVRHVECVAALGTGGCGFEQQLEALYTGLTVQTGPGMPNDDFLRDDSLVAVLTLTDEDDCSTGNSEMFNPSRDDLGPLNVRCAFQDDELYDVARYIGGLQELRSDPQDVIFALVAGVPEDLVADPDAVDLDDVLADERMRPTVNPSNPNELLTSCDTAIGRAYPPRRMVEVAAGFGGNAVVQSICQEDFTPVIGAILDQVASRVRGECL